MAMAVVQDMGSGLLELDQRAAEILRVQEQDRLAVGADLRFAVAEDARALVLEPVAGGADVVDLVADVMDAAVRIALEELRDRRALPEWRQQLDLRVGQDHEHGGDAVIGLPHGGRYLGAQAVAINGGRLGEIADRDGDVIEAADHEDSAVSSER